MRCPICNCGHSTAVTNTYSDTEFMYKGKRIKITKRRRMCRNCQHVFSTFEKNIEDTDDIKEVKPNQGDQDNE